MEGSSLPIIPTVPSGFNKEGLFKRVGNECRRCHGTGIEPGEEYSCLLCRGFKVERHLPSKLVCVKHPDQELVPVAKRWIVWDDGMGFDHQGYYQVKGCPMCGIAMLQTGSLAE